MAVAGVGHGVDAGASVVIVGGGITGAAAAYWLASEGHAPLLLESHAIAAMGSGWSLGGVRQSGRDPAELPLAQAAVALWPTLAERLDGDTEYRQHGNLRLARTEQEVATIAALVARQRALGLDLTLLTSNQAVRAIAPAVSDRVMAASFCPTDGHANPALTTHAFARAAERHGATLRTGVDVHAITTRGGRVTGLETSAGRIAADTVILAAGIRTPDLLPPLGLALPLRVSAVTVLQSAPLPPTFAQVFGVANADCAGRQEVDGRFRVTSGGTNWDGLAAAWATAELVPDTAERQRLTDHITTVLPTIATVPIERTWRGLIDVTPDALPVIDAPPDLPGLVIAAGFSGHGFGIGPITGRLAADLALRRAPTLSVEAFRLDRLAHTARHLAAPTLHG